MAKAAWAVLVLIVSGLLYAGMALLVWQHKMATGGQLALTALVSFGYGITVLGTAYCYSKSSS